jgi:uncharacterized protein (DUF302 family)
MLAAAALAVVTLIPSFAADESSFAGSRVAVTTNKSFADVNKAVKSLVAKNGMMIMAEVNQGKMMSMAGLKLDATLYIIGNPTVGKQIFEQDHGVGLYVPLRLFVYTDQSGTTHVAYDKPSTLLSQFRNEKIGMVAQMLDQKLNDLANMAAH